MLSLFADVINTDGFMEELIVSSLVIQKLLKRAWLCSFRNSGSLQCYWSNCMWHGPHLYSPMVTSQAQPYICTGVFRFTASQWWNNLISSSHSTIRDQCFRKFAITTISAYLFITKKDYRKANISDLIRGIIWLH